MHLNLYDVLRNLISVTTDVVIINGLTNKVIGNHSSKYVVKDDVPRQLWNLKVTSISVHPGFPNKLVVYIDD